jgi:hypothetical protein
VHHLIKKMTTKLHILSDLHLDQNRDFVVPEVDANILVLAGDITTSELSHLAPIYDASHRYDQVLYVPGNHEHYGGDMESSSISNLEAAFKDKNFTLMNSRSHTIKEDNLMILGTTLWTDFNKGDEEEMRAAEMCMNDFRGSIKVYGKNLTPKNTIDFNKFSKEWIALHQDEPRLAAFRQVVVSHHLPSMELINPKYEGSALNHAFASNQEHLFDHPLLWVCGHSHTAFDKEVKGLRIVSNPLGYPGEETGFNPELVIEIP